MFLMEQAADIKRYQWLGTLLVAASLSGLPSATLAQVADEFIGKWSSDPSRCQQVALRQTTIPEFRCG